MPVHFFHTLKSFTQFLWNWKLEGSPLVDQNTANIRAETCLSCHNNLPSGDVRRGCGVCNKLGNRALSGLREQIIAKNSTSFDGKLLTCGICGCDLKISVWIPNKVLLSKEDSNAYPSFCWRKAIDRDADI
jgi:hypothetical protein